MSDLFIGSAICSVSNRGQLSLPPAFCVTVQSRSAKDCLYVAFHENSPCLIVFDRETAADQHSRLAERRNTDDELGQHDDLLRRSFGFAAPSYMDGRGRLSIARWMQKRPGQRTQMLAVGKGDHFELWDLKFVMDHGPEILGMLARLHLHLVGKEEHCDEPDLPLFGSRDRSRSSEPGIRVQPLPPVQPRPSQVASLL